MRRALSHTEIDPQGKHFTLLDPCQDPSPSVDGDDEMYGRISSLCRSRPMWEPGLGLPGRCVLDKAQAMVTLEQGNCQPRTRGKNILATCGHKALGSVEPL